MAKSSGRESKDLRSSFDGIFERAAETRGRASGRDEVRDLAYKLVRDVITAMGGATLGEIQEAMEALAALPKSAPTKANGLQRSDRVERTAQRSAGSVSVAGSARSEAHEPDATAAGRRDPFDITMPSELLDTSTGVAPREEERPPASVRRVRPRSPRPSPAPASKPTQPSILAHGSEPQEPQRVPVVSLREGEQLVRASGSGVIIRRARTA
jgi:hypothetical protein